MYKRQGVVRSPRDIIGQASEADSEIAHEILDKIEDVAERVTSKRVVLASIMALLIGMASLLAVVWIIPYENVDVEVVYMQAGGGHVVLAELDNKGSRAIEDVSLTIRFLDSEGLEIDRHDFYMAKLPAHSSISNTPSDDLELVVLGQSVWDNYLIEISDVQGGRIIISARATAEINGIEVDLRGVVLDAQITGGVPSGTSLGVNGFASDLSLLNKIPGFSGSTSHWMAPEPMSSGILTVAATLGGMA